jgi:hypothetical protein
MSRRIYYLNLIHIVPRKAGREAPPPAYSIAGGFGANPEMAMRYDLSLTGEVRPPFEGVWFEACAHAGLHIFRTKKKENFFLTCPLSEIKCHHSFSI